MPPLVVTHVSWIYRLFTIELYLIFLCAKPMKYYLIIILPNCTNIIIILLVHLTCPWVINFKETIASEASVQSLLVARHHWHERCNKLCCDIVILLIDCHDIVSYLFEKDGARWVQYSEVHLASSIRSQWSILGGWRHSILTTHTTPFMVPFYLGRRFEHVFSSKKDTLL